MVNVGRFKPAKVTAKTKPKTDSKEPFTFTTKGRILLPAGVTAAAGCTGTVVVTFKAGNKKVSTRKAKVSDTCSYRSKVTFSLPARVDANKLSVRAKFRGNAVLTSRASKRSSVKVA